MQKKLFFYRSFLLLIRSAECQLGKLVASHDNKALAVTIINQASIRDQQKQRRKGGREGIR